MAFKFDDLFKEALNNGLNAAGAGANAARDWLQRTASANAKTLKSIADAVAAKEISKETAEMLLRENTRAMESEAAALSAISKAAAQGALNAFLNTLLKGLSTGLKLAL